MVYIPIPSNVITIPIHESIQHTWWFVTSQPLTTLYVAFYISIVALTVAVPDKEKKHAKA